MKISPRRLYTFFPVLAATALLFAGMALFSGCYTLKQGVLMLGYLGRAQDLETLEDPGGPPENRIFAERVADIRRFAMEELGLRETSNYTRYVEIDRDYLVAVVSASARDSFDRHEWWFPVVGRLPYKGFFNREDALKEQAKLQKKDLDVWIRGVDAFSTLGWFSDPLYSYMKEYPEHQLAELLIHELLHATVFLKGRPQFNEELAEFVGRRGARLYIERTFGTDSEEWRRMINGEADNAAYLSFIRLLISELEELYAGEASREAKLQKKAETIRAAQERFQAEYDSLFQSENYRGFARLPVNNAYLELFRLYYSGGDYLEDLYTRSGGDLKRFIDAAKSLKARGDPQEQFTEALGL